MHVHECNPLMKIPASRQKKHPSHVSSLIFLVRCIKYACLLALVALTAACADGSSVQNTTGKQTAAAVTPTQQVHKGPPKGTILYKANWSRGLKGWKGASGWVVQHGDLYSKEDDEDVLTLPYVAPTTNYSVEIRIQVVSYASTGRGSFSFFTQHSGQTDGYRAGVSGLLAPGPRPNGLNPQLQAFIDPENDMEQNGEEPFDYDPLQDWHTYRLDIQGSQIDFFADGVNAYTASSTATQFLSSGPLNIQSHAIVLRVSNLTITAL